MCGECILTIRLQMYKEFFEKLLKRTPKIPTSLKWQTQYREVFFSLKKKKKKTYGLKDAFKMRCLFFRRTWVRFPTPTG